jgi:hypothetical protein
MFTETRKKCQWNPNVEKLQNRRKNYGPRGYPRGPWQKKENAGSRPAISA